METSEGTRSLKRGGLSVTRERIKPREAPMTDGSEVRLSYEWRVREKGSERY